MAPLRAYSLRRLCLCSTLALTTAFSPSLSIAQQAVAAPAAGANAAAAKTDLNYVVPGAIVMVIAKPAQLLSSPAAEMFPIEVLQAASIKEVGLDPLKADEVVFSASPPVMGPPSYALLATFAEEFALKPSELTKHTQPATLAGKSYLKSMAPDPAAPSFIQPTAEQLLIGPDATITALMGGKTNSASGLLAAYAKSSFNDDDLLVIVDATTIRPFINMGLAQAKLPPELTPLLQIPNLLKLVELRLNLSRSAVSELVITANDEEDAAKIIEIYNAARQTMSDKVAEESRKALASDDPVEQAAGRYSQRMSKMWDSQFRLTQDKNRVVLFQGDFSKSEGNQLTYAATMGVLVALLLPAIQAAREAARRNMSINNMKQLMLSLLNYESAKKTFPAYTNFDADGKPLLSWRVHILPYMEQAPLYKQFHLDEPWDSDHNKKLIAKMPELFLDPSSRFTPVDGMTHYLGVKGDGYLFDGSGSGMSMRKITDGTSNSIALVQVDDEAAVPWTKPDDWTPSETDLMKPFDGPHPGGFLAAFCDGHVQFISNAIEPSVLRALLTTAGEEVINP